MMVTGDAPFKANGPLDSYMKKIENDLTPPRRLVPALSERIDWAIQRAMSVDPERRPATCREFVEDLTGRSTRKMAANDPAGDNHDNVWYLVYKDDEGVTHTVKGTVAGIRRSLKEGVLGDASNVRASRSKQGEFEFLRSFPEFRDLVIELAPLGVAPGIRTPSAIKALSTSGMQEAPTVPAAAAFIPTSAPHIPVTQPRRPAGRAFWPQAILLLFLALAAAAAGYFLF